MIGKKISNGLTVIELLVALAIAAVMLAYAVPAFNDFADQRRIASSSNMIIAGVNYARSEAARLGTSVTLQTMNGGDDTNEWGPGFCVTAGTPGNCDTPLNIFEPEANVTLDGIDGLDGLVSLTFDSTGMLTGAVDGDIEVCGASAAEDPGRVIRLNAIGRASSGELECFAE